MDNFDPFGGAGFPGDPMEQVLSLQAFSDVGAVVPACNRTNACRICGDTYSCDTIGCTLSCPIGPGETVIAPDPITIADGW